MWGSKRKNIPQHTEVLRHGLGTYECATQPRQPQTQPSTINHQPSTTTPTTNRKRSMGCEEGQPSTLTRTRARARVHCHRMFSTPPRLSIAPNPLHRYYHWGEGYFHHEFPPLYKGKTKCRGTDLNNNSGTSLSPFGNHSDAVDGVYSMQLFVTEASAEIKPHHVCNHLPHPPFPTTWVYSQGCRRLGGKVAVDLSNVYCRDCGLFGTCWLLVVGCWFLLRCARC